MLDGLTEAANLLREADKIPQYQAVLDAYSQISELQAKNYTQQLQIQELTCELENIRRDQKSAEGAKIWMHLCGFQMMMEPTACIALTSTNVFFMWQRSCIRSSARWANA
jgi:hypothetical protein